MDSSSTLNSAATNALTLTWAFGFNKDVVDGVHSLCAGGREALFYVAAHTGVIYDYAKRTQELLQVISLPLNTTSRRRCPRGPSPSFRNRITWRVEFLRSISTV